MRIIQNVHQTPRDQLDDNDEHDNKKIQRSHHEHDDHDDEHNNRKNSKTDKRKMQHVHDHHRPKNEHKIKSPRGSLKKIAKPHNDHNEDADHHESDHDDDIPTAASTSDDGDEGESDTKSSYYLNANELNNTRKADVDVILFNRAAKVGSQSLMQLMTSLGMINGYTTSRNPGNRYETVLLAPEKQRELAAEILAKPKPHAYSQHLAYINFTRFHMPKPIYINLVRHPVERVISWHYYVRAEWYYIDMKDKLGDLAPPRPSDEFMKMDLDTCVRTQDKYCQFTQDDILNSSGDHRRQTLFFCGQNKKVCMPFNSQAAMQKAKRTVEQDYAVVGTWEDTNITLTVLEHYIPKFFQNAKIVYYLDKDRLSKVNRNPVKRPVSQETRDILNKNFTNEIEFYEFCKQRLYMQYGAISKFKKIDNDDYIILPEHDESDEIYDEDY